jgi:hypothetical protein
LSDAVPNIERLTVITGHYGSGKTNLSINLALDLAEKGGPVTLVDLDVVNPYFRSSDYAALLTARGVRVVSPSFAGTTLDTPSLSAAVYSVFESEGHVIFDAGGDDAGSTALGRYSDNFAGTGYDLLYVVNRYRNLTAMPEEAAALLPEIESASHLRATGVVNNSHLKQETTVATVADSIQYARECAALLGLPLRFTTVPKRLACEFSEAPGAPGHVENVYPVEIYVRTPWERGVGEVDA